MPLFDIEYIESLAKAGGIVKNSYPPIQIS
jgi:hypothetical protein